MTAGEITIIIVTAIGLPAGIDIARARRSMPFLRGHQHTPRQSGEGERVDVDQSNHIGGVY